MHHETQGITGIDITSAGFLHNPEELFKLTHVLNSGKAKEDWIQMEVYPTLSRFPKPTLNPINTLLKPMLNKLGLPDLPVGLTAETIQEYQEKYPNTKISRVHLPFFYNYREFYERIRGDQQMFGLIKGTWTSKNLAAFLFFFGRAVNLKGVKLAHQLEKQGVGINAHPTILEGFANEGKLPEVKSKTAFVLAENDVNHPSKLLPQSAVSEPKAIVERVIKRHSLDGLLLGIDHELYDDNDASRALETPEIAKYIKAIHLAKADYSLIDLKKDAQINGLLRLIGRAKFSSPVRMALENYPQYIHALNFEEKVKYFQELIEGIKSNQSS